MSTVSSFPISVVACCSCCFTDATATIVEVIAPLVALQFPGSGPGQCSPLHFSAEALWQGWSLKASLAYIACRAMILMTTDTESGPEMPFNCQACALVICQSPDSLLPAS